MIAKAGRINQGVSIEEYLVGSLLPEKENRTHQLFALNLRPGQEWRSGIRVLCSRGYQPIDILVSITFCAS